MHGLNYWGGGKADSYDIWFNGRHHEMIGAITRWKPRGDGDHYAALVKHAGVWVHYDDEKRRLAGTFLDPETDGIPYIYVYRRWDTHDIGTEGNGKLDFRGSGPWIADVVGQWECELHKRQSAILLEAKREELQKERVRRGVDWAKDDAQLHLEVRFVDWLHVELWWSGDVDDLADIFDDFGIPLFEGARGELARVVSATHVISDLEGLDISALLADGLLETPCSVVFHEPPCQWPTWQRGPDSLIQGFKRELMSFEFVSFESKPAQAAR